MSAWGGGPTDHSAGAPIPTGRPPRRSNEERRVIALVVLFVAAILLVGLGAFLLGTRQTTEMVGGSSGDASPAIDAPPASAEVTTTATPTTVAVTIPEVTIPEVTTPEAAPPATTTLPPEAVDNSAAARADLELHFANHDQLDLDAAYTGLTTTFAPPVDEFVQFWSVDVASVNSPIDECDVTGARGVCAVRFFITYSEAAAESLRNRCLGQSVELTMQRTDGRFLIDEQRVLGSLACPAQ